KQFRAHAAAIHELHRRQNQATVAALKAKYENAVFGKVRVWDLIEKLALCVDPTDSALFCANQFIHVQQVIAGMEASGVQDRDLFLAALTHDLGKVTLLTDELPENVVSITGKIGDYPPGIGLDHVIFQFGHGEMIYSRLKGHVPDHVAWLLRYHGTTVA